MILYPGETFETTDEDGNTVFETKPITAADKADMIFVFGSNRAGVHGAGAAKDARDNHGARDGVGEGPSGKAYALPTKDRAIQTLSLEEIEAHIKKFLEFASLRPLDLFQITQVGTGLAGYTKAQIAPFFVNAPRNCYFDSEWSDILPSHAKVWGTYTGPGANNNPNNPNN